MPRALDAGRNELLRLDLTTVEPSIVKLRPVAPHSRKVVVSADGRLACVTSLWSERLTLVDLASDGVEGQSRHVELPFAADQALLVDGDRSLLVADAFRGRLAIVDLATARVEAVREFAGHNIRGLALSRDGEYVYVVMQHLNPQALADFDDVTWGILFFNGVRAIKRESLLDPTRDPLEDARALSLGMAEDHAGDPGQLTVEPDGLVISVLSGSGNIAIGTERFDLQPVQVGNRPVAAVRDAARGVVYALNQFSDSVTVVDVAERVTVREISLGPESPKTSEQRGRVVLQPPASPTTAG
ncbi:MAG: hypothetical protein R3B90_23580 [Planctomycetaceae bacterium]